MRLFLRIFLTLLLAPPLISIVLGWLVAPAFLHPIRRALTPDLIQQADVSFGQLGARREAFDVRAPDGVLLRGWKVRAAHPNGSWVVLFHGVADNRMGGLEHSRFLLRAGYSVTMMDTRAILDELVATEHPAHIFALGESMGAGIALQSAAVDPRAEALFASIREASYDYAGLQKYPLLGKTLFAPGAWVMLARGQALAGFPAVNVSPERAIQVGNHMRSPGSPARRFD
jgi:hypothetical protein